MLGKFLLYKLIHVPGWHHGHLSLPLSHPSRASPRLHLLQSRHPPSLSRSPHPSYPSSNHWLTDLASPNSPRDSPLDSLEDTSKPSGPLRVRAECREDKAGNSVRYKAGCGWYVQLDAVLGVACHSNYAFMRFDKYLSGDLEGARYRGCFTDIHKYRQHNSAYK